MLSLIALLCIFTLFNYLSKCAREEQQQLVYYDSAIDMDDSNMSDTQSHMDMSADATGEQNNLIINYLPETTTQSDLQEMFQVFGEIESCRLIRHKPLGYSLGYGFVKYCKHEDALTAIERMNGLTLQSKTLKVSFARPANDPIKTANLYVSGLKNTITEADIVTIFSPFGKVLSVKVMHNDNDPAKTSAIGFVRFENQSEATIAVTNLNGTKPAGNPIPIHVSFAKQSKDSQPPVVIIPSPTVPFNASFPNGRFPGFGKQPTMFGGRNIRYDPLSRGQMGRNINVVDNGYGVDPQSSNHILFVFNLAPGVEELHLYRLFSPYGGIRNINIVNDKATNKSKGYAFIHMNNYVEAETAIRVLDQSVVDGKIIHVSFKKPSHKH